MASLYILLLRNMVLLNLALHRNLMVISFIASKGKRFMECRMVERMGLLIKAKIIIGVVFFGVGIN